MTEWEAYLESDQAREDCEAWILEHADELATHRAIRDEWEAGDGYTNWLDSIKAGER